MLIVTCIPSVFSLVLLLALLDCVFYIVEVFCWVPDFNMFW